MVDKDVVKNKLINLEEYISDLSKYKSLTIDEYNEDKILQRYLERTLHLAVESILDIGSHIISDERMGSPNNNSDIIKILAERKVIKSNKDKYIKMAQFRNIIVHDYAQIDPEVILGIINNNLEDLKAVFRWFRDYVS